MHVFHLLGLAGEWLSDKARLMLQACGSGFAILPTYYIVPATWSPAATSTNHCCGNGAFLCSAECSDLWGTRSGLRF
jgi:hypothetical protein